jgi:hypothetical protein
MVANLPKRAPRKAIDNTLKLRTSARMITTAQSEGRIFDSNVDTAGGSPKLVATANVWSNPLVRVNRAPLRAAQTANMAARTATTGSQAIVKAKMQDNL